MVTRRGVWTRSWPVKTSVPGVVLDLRMEMSIGKTLISVRASFVFGLGMTIHHAI
jgi:hypothetical protein